jgi:hypothetical protein
VENRNSASVVGKGDKNSYDDVAVAEIVVE